jgi:hypothetical protein
VPHLCVDNLSRTSPSCHHLLDDPYACSNSPRCSITRRSASPATFLDRACKWHFHECLVCAQVFKLPCPIPLSIDSSASPCLPHQVPFAQCPLQQLLIGVLPSESVMSPSPVSQFGGARWQPRSELPLTVEQVPRHPLGAAQLVKPSPRHLARRRGPVRSPLSSIGAPPWLAILANLSAPPPPLHQSTTAPSPCHRQVLLSRSPECSPISSLAANVVPPQCNR